MYYLIDIARTITNNKTMFWRENKKGYTKDITDAGIYGEIEALIICKEDIDKDTVMLPIGENRRIR